MQFPHALVNETLAAMAHKLEDLQRLEEEQVPDPVALASIESARGLLERACEIMARLSASQMN